MNRTFAAALLLALPACTGSSGTTTPTTGRATVRFVYRASTTTRTDIPASLALCARGASPTHGHLGWRDFALVNMTAVGADQWELTVDDAPVGPRNTILISDPNTCLENPDGFATRNLSANNVALTTIVRPSAGTGFEFSVAADGRVTP